MGEFFLIVGLVILTAVIFVVWLVVHLTGVVFRAVFRGGSGKSVEGSSNETLPTGWKACRHGGKGSPGRRWARVVQWRA